MIGNSSKFLYVVKKNWPDALITMQSWRKPKMSTNSYDMVVLCGYDYSSYLRRYDDFSNVNIFSIVRYLEKLDLSKAEIIYINTNPGSKNHTFSRYYYAKMKLAVLLKENFKSVHILSIPTVIEDYELGRSSSPISPWLKYLLLKFKMIEVVNSDGLIKLVGSYKNSKDFSFECPEPIFLKIRRPVFIDRVMRIILG